MLHSLNALEKCTIGATDGDIGQVKDLYFDDHAWAVRHLIVDTGSWLFGRKVLISPISIRNPDWPAHRLAAAITQNQVRNSPDIDTDKPVSRQHEMDYLGYYGYPAYWDSVGIWGVGSVPGMTAPEIGLAPTGVGVLEAERSIAAERAAARQRDDDPHLRSCQSVSGYHIKAQDGEIGHVQGWIVDDESWAIRYLVVDTSNWWLGHQVLIAPQWVREVSWSDKIVVANMTRNAIQNAPEWDAALLPDRAQEVDIYRHYDRTGYW